MPTFITQYSSLVCLVAFWFAIYHVGYGYAVLPRLAALPHILRLTAYGMRGGRSPSSHCLLPLPPIPLLHYTAPRCHMLLDAVRSTCALRLGVTFARHIACQHYLPTFTRLFGPLPPYPLPTVTLRGYRTALHTFATTTPFFVHILHCLLLTFTQFWFYRIRFC